MWLCLEKHFEDGSIGAPLPTERLLCNLRIRPRKGCPVWEPFWWFWFCGFGPFFDKLIPLGLGFNSQEFNTDSIFWNL